MSPSKTQNKPLLNPSPRPPVGAPAQEAVGLHPQPDPLADACGNAPRKKSRTAASGTEADACGNAPRKKTRSAARGVEADACGNAPRKKTRPVGRSGHIRGRRPHRRRSLATVTPSLPHLSPDSPGMEGEIALLRSLTNRLLSKRPIDHVQISRYLRILARSLPANSRMPRELTDEEQIDSLIKKVFQDYVDNGNLDFHDIVSVRMAKPGEKWWPWRQLLSLETRWRYGLIDPDERWPQEENERLVENEGLTAEVEAMDRLILKYYPGPFPDPDEEDSDDEDPDDDHCPDYDPLPYGEAPPTLTVIPEKSEANPLPDTPPDEEPPRNDLTVIPAEAETHPRKESHLSSKTLQPENPPQQDAPSHESIPRAAPDPPDLTIIPDSDRVEDVEDAPGRALRRESIPRGGAAHPERRRRVERGGGPALPIRHTGPPPPRTARGRPRPP